MEHSVYLQALKQCLKAKGLTYTDLARQLKMSESGVKKMLNAKDISLRRILKACEVVGVSPGQLFTNAENLAVPTVVLNPQQETALLKDRRLLAVYWLVAIEKRSLAEIQRTQGMSVDFLKSRLEKLVALDLLSHRKGVYRPTHQGKFRWPDDSKIAKALNKEWSELTLARALQQTNGSHRLIALKLSKESYQTLERKLSEALTDAARDSEREELSRDARELINITALIAAVPRGIFD